MTESVLITGGAGYVGSHTCKALAAVDYLPVCLDNLISGHKWAVQWGTFIAGDIADSWLLDQIFSDYRPKAVIHFAAYASVGESVEQPAKYYQNNVIGSISLLEAMRRHGCKNIIFSSSCSTYGMPQQVPIPENHPQLPINPYGRTKLMMEQIIQAVQQVTGKSVAYRPVGRRPGDPPALVARAEQAASLLGWKPDYIDIQATISTAWHWCQSQSTTQSQ